ncbi:MAG: ketose-bisphosphate aldolase [bacterium]
MLVTGSTLLDIADRHDFAVPAFNVSDYAMFNALVDACENTRSPMFVAIHPDELSHIGVDLMPAILAHSRNADVPIAVHLDHGADYGQVLTAIRAGFSSVMIDGSALPFDDNVAVTAKAVEAAHSVGLSVEGELGTIGQGDAYGESGSKQIIYTDPADAITFVERTGVDSLAVAIGTFHGLVPADLKPELKIDLLREIKKIVGVPLVLHGGSSNPDSEIAEGVREGLNKINISSDIKIAYYSKMREVLKDEKLREPNAIEPPAMQAMIDTAVEKIKLFCSDGKADLY